MENPSREVFGDNIPVRVIDLDKVVAEFGLKPEDLDKVAVIVVRATGEITVNLRDVDQEDKVVQEPSHPNGIGHELLACFCYILGTVFYIMALWKLLHGH